MPETVQHTKEEAMLRIARFVGTIPFPGIYSRIRHAFSVVVDQGAFWNAVREAGYTHYIKLKPREHVDPIEHAYLFFKGAPPIFRPLADGRARENVRVLEIKPEIKCTAELTPRQLAAWIAEHKLEDAGGGALEALEEFARAS